MKDKWTTALTNRSKKSSTTHLKPWSVSCVALWKSKGVTLKPTPTCVRRNNPGSQGKTHCSRDVGSRCCRERVSRLLLPDVFFSVSNKSIHHQLRSFPPVTPGRRALPARGTFQQKAGQRPAKRHLTEVN